MQGSRNVLRVVVDDGYLIVSNFLFAIAFAVFSSDADLPERPPQAGSLPWRLSAAGMTPTDSWKLGHRRP